MDFYQTNKYKITNMDANVTNRQINRLKLSKLQTANEFLDEKYGKIGSETRDQFESETLLFIIGELLKEVRLNNNLTQQELAERTGLKRPYISKIEKGETDMQITNFFRVLYSLDLSSLNLKEIFFNASLKRKEISV